MATVLPAAGPETPAEVGGRPSHSTGRRLSPPKRVTAKDALDDYFFLGGGAALIGRLSGSLPWDWALRAGVARRHAAVPARARQKKAQRRRLSQRLVNTHVAGHALESLLGARRIPSSSGRSASSPGATPVRAGTRASWRVPRFIRMGLERAASVVRVGRHPCPALPLLYARDVFCTSDARQRWLWFHEVAPFAGLDVVRSVAFGLRVHDDAAHLVAVAEGELSMSRGAGVADRQASARSCSSGERNAAVVCMHVEPRIFVRLVAHYKTVVCIEACRLERPQEPRHGPVGIRAGALLWPPAYLSRSR